MSDTQMDPIDAERIRQQERAKLQSKIGDLEQTVQNLTSQLSSSSQSPAGSVSSALADVLDKLNSTLSRTNASSKQSQDLSEVKQTLQQIMEQTAKQTQQAPAQEGQKFDELKKQLDTMQQRLWKSEALREAGPEVIPDLVAGSTEEEIRASVERAKSVYKSIEERILQTVSKPAETQAVQTAENAQQQEAVPQEGEQTTFNAQQPPVRAQQPMIGPGPEPVLSESGAALVQQLASLTDPLARTQFFNEHRNALKSVAEAAGASYYG